MKGVKKKNINPAEKKTTMGRGRDEGKEFLGALARLGDGGRRKAGAQNGEPRGGG